MTQDWSEYIASIQESEAVMAANKLQLEINSTPIPVTISYRTLTFTYEEGGNSTSKTASYIVTPTGYKFYQPIEILGNEIEGFTYNVADDSFTTIGSVAATMLKIVPPINEQFVAGDWFIKFSTLGNFGQTYFNHVKTNFLDPMGEQLQYAFVRYLNNRNYNYAVALTTLSPIVICIILYLLSIVNNSNSVFINCKACYGYKDGFNYFNE